MHAQPLQLDPTLRSLESRDFETGMRRKIVGQDEAVQAVVGLYQVFRAGLNSPGRPVGNLLFLGPTGAGKTRVVEATAEVLFSEGREAATVVDTGQVVHHGCPTYLLDGAVSFHGEADRAGQHVGRDARPTRHRDVASRTRGRRCHRRYQP